LSAGWRPQQRQKQERQRQRQQFQTALHGRAGHTATNVCGPPRYSHGLH
jgi:hypothetical protein